MKPCTFSLRFTELPLWIWALGYAEFLWQTLGPGSSPLGLPTLLGALLLSLATLASFLRNRPLEPLLRELKTSWQRYRLVTIAYLLCFSCLALELSLGLFSALRPPHLPQDYDAIHYQMGIPRQLLLRHSLSWIRWSVADLWPMALQWGMAPLSLAFSTVNKLPQFFCALGAAACLLRLARRLQPGESALLPLTLPLLAFFGAHGVMIQLGAGLMDLPAQYLLLLGLLSLLERRYFVAALALAVYTGSKAFHPFQMGAVAAFGLVWLWRARIPFPLPRFASLFLALTVLLLARSSLVSLQATGTPLFPFGACRIAQGELCSGKSREILEESTQGLLGTRDLYGNGRGPLAFMQHLWRVAVPSSGVNNEFDYPLGLPWLLLMVLLGFSLARGGRRDPMVQLTLLFWLLWWLNSHQSRWLYPVLAFGFLATLPLMIQARRFFPFLLATSLVFSLISQVRSLLPTAHLSAREIQAREEAKVRWAGKGVLVGNELLYVSEPAPDHVPGGHLWILR
jgi:hypothetical protein